MVEVRTAATVEHPDLISESGGVNIFFIVDANERVGYIPWPIARAIARFRDSFSCEVDVNMYLGVYRSRGAGGGETIHLDRRLFESGMQLLHESLIPIKMEYDFDNPSDAILQALEVIFCERKDLERAKRKIETRRNQLKKTVDVIVLIAHQLPSGGPSFEAVAKRLRQLDVSIFLFTKPGRSMRKDYRELFDHSNKQFARKFDLDDKKLEEHYEKDLGFVRKWLLRQYAPKSTLFYVLLLLIAVLLGILILSEIRDEHAGNDGDLENSSGPSGPADPQKEAKWSEVEKAIEATEPVVEVVEVKDGSFRFDEILDLYEVENEQQRAIFHRLLRWHNASLLANYGVDEVRTLEGAAAVSASELLVLNRSSLKIEEDKSGIREGVNGDVNFFFLGDLDSTEIAEKGIVADLKVIEVRRP